MGGSGEGGRGLHSEPRQPWLRLSQTKARGSRKSQNVSGHRWEEWVEVIQQNIELAPKFPWRAFRPASEKCLESLTFPVWAELFQRKLDF